MASAPSAEPVDVREVLAIVPCFNEAEAITGTVRDLTEANPGIQVVVVNDGSTDRSREVLRGLPGVRVLDLPVNLGIGGAVQAGFRYFLTTGCQVALQFDGDGQHRGDEIPRLLTALMPPYDVAVGSRFIGPTAGFRSSLLRRVGIRVIRTMVRLLAGVDVADATSGFRAYSRRAVEHLVEDYPDDFAEPVSAVLLHRHDLRLVEVPVRMRERQGGTSSISGLKPVYFMLKVTLALFVARLGLVGRPR